MFAARPALGPITLAARPAILSCGRPSSTAPAAIPRVLSTRLHPPTHVHQTTSSSTSTTAHETETSPSLAGESIPIQSGAPSQKDLAVERPSNAHFTLAVSRDPLDSLSLTDKIARVKKRKAALGARSLSSKDFAAKRLQPLASLIWQDDPAWVPPELDFEGCTKETRVEGKTDDTESISKTLLSSASPEMAPSMTLASDPRKLPKFSSSDLSLLAPAGTSTTSPPSPVSPYAPNPLVKRTSVLISEAELAIVFGPLIALGWTVDIEPTPGRKEGEVRTVLARKLDIEDLHHWREPTDPASEKEDFRQRATWLAGVLTEMFRVHKHHADISFDDSKFEIRTTTHQTNSPAVQLVPPTPAFPLPKPTDALKVKVKVKAQPTPHGLTGKDLALALSMHCAIYDIGSLSSEELAGEESEA